ncbi:MULTISPECIES: hypothetical protein [Lysinibacillus]|uniref:hypothetical protein n=1 Tax=Lysinibacillus TaxID=400634 RepID=UPI00257E6612|nr:MULTISPECIES: hypothetical protein [Lysinibacillus]
MMYKIGVVGPIKSVEKIIELAHEIDQDMTFIPYIYSIATETKDIVESHNQDVDFWLFSGYIPYKIASQTSVSQDKLAHIIFSEAAIYKGFLEESYKRKKFIENVSIDIIPSPAQMATEGLADIEQNVRNMYLKEFDVAIDPKELFEFHFGLWQEGKIDFAITCYPSVDEQLRRMGVPSYWVSPTKTEIYHTVQLFTERIKTSYYKETQIGAVMLEIKDFDSLKERMKQGYRIQYLELRIKENLLQLCERIDGSLVVEGNGRYTIFSTRGAIEGQIQFITEKMYQLSIEMEGKVTAGIGFAQTVFNAELHAHRGLRQTKANESIDIVMVQDDGTIIESVGNIEELSYSYRAEDPDILEKLKRGSISIKTYTKIQALVQKMRWKHFTTKDLATQLQMSERNAQRIVADLCSVGLAKIAGEELQHTRGRPIKMYQLVMHRPTY